MNPGKQPAFFYGWAIVRALLMFCGGLFHHTGQKIFRL